MYDAFAATQFGGSQAAIVLNAHNLDKPTRIQIAKELGYPATVFVSTINDNQFTAQFYSTVAELPMCGHGTVALVGCLNDLKLIDWANGPSVQLRLKLPEGDAKVLVTKGKGGSALAMLDVRVAQFRDDGINRQRLCDAIGLPMGAISEHPPIETALADFIHLIVPVQGLAQMRSIQPDFTEIASLHPEFGIETLTVICTEVVNPVAGVHVRDFCPAVGVAESAAAGTTNAAVAGYLFRHRLMLNANDQHIDITAEQGIELARPSEVHSRLVIENNVIREQWVGGIARRVASGELYVD